MNKVKERYDRVLFTKKELRPIPGWGQRGRRFEPGQPDQEGSRACYWVPLGEETADAEIAYSPHGTRLRISTRIRHWDALGGLGRGFGIVEGVEQLGFP